MTGGEEEEIHQAMTGGEEEEYHEAMTGGEAQLWVMKFKTTLSGVEPEEFNTNPNMIQAFKATIVQMLVDVDLNDIYDVEAIASDTHMRRRLLAANEATVSYKVRATSKAQTTQAKTDMVKGNDAFSDILNTEMLKHDVPLVSPMRATTSDNIVVEEESQEEVVEEMKESKEYHQEMTGGEEEFHQGMTGGEEHHEQHMHESPPTAEQVYDDAKDDEMDDKIAKFEATAVCTSVDDCVEGCKSFTATDDDVQEGICEMPGLFVCGDDNLCDVHVPDHGGK
jgi:hypothetical protein